MIRLGYAGSNTLLPGASGTFRIANYSEERMLQVADSNIKALENILRWNLKNGIFLFRISSDVIPYGSSVKNSGVWMEKFSNDLARIGKFARKNGMRLSMHPGQYAVLNTPSKPFLENSLRDLEYHASILELIGLDCSHYIIVHGGGAYGNKAKSLNVLKRRISSLPQNIRKRLALENDEKIFNAQDTLDVCNEMEIPAVFDVLHHSVLGSMEQIALRDIVKAFGKTWKNDRQKVHYSDQDPDKKKGAHSRSIDIDHFMQFYAQIKDFELDIMLEVKDKQTSVLKLNKTINK